MRGDMWWFPFLVVMWQEGCISFLTAMRYWLGIYEWWESDIRYHDFWIEINFGWYAMYIWPYDDLYQPKLSKERQLRLNDKSFS